MPYFRYRVVDLKGQELEGTIRSDDRRRAAEALQARGFRVLSIEEASPTADQPAAAPSAQPARVVHPYRGSEKSLHFVLGQMAELLRAGVNPAQGFATLSQNQPNAGYRRSLAEMAEAASRGGAISEVMGRYPGLYPEHVAAIVRAGEHGGFLPEALSVAANQAKEAYLFKKWHWFLWLIPALFVVVIPMTVLAGHSFNAAFRKAWSGAGGSTGGAVMRDMAADVVQTLKWPVGPYLLLSVGLLLGSYLWLSSDARRRLRHRLGLRYPSLRKRAKMECLSLFTWAASRLSQAGVPPSTVWEMAAACVPNAEMQAQLMQAGRQMREGSRLTDAVRAARVLPDEYAPLLATAEMTGTVPGTLERLSNAARGEYETQTAKAKTWGCALGCFWLGVIGPIGMIIVLYYYYDVLRMLLEEIGQ